MLGRATLHRLDSRDRQDRPDPPAELPGETTADTVSLGDAPGPRSRLDRGVCVGRYVIIDWLGEGGMGVVYKAYDPELERAVALKLLHTAGAPHSSSASGHRERLLREAKALARLSHPNVLAIFDVGTFGDDVFLATEFVEGPTLAAWLRERGPRGKKRCRCCWMRAKGSPPRTARGWCTATSSPPTSSSRRTAGLASSISVSRARSNRSVRRARGAEPLSRLQPSLEDTTHPATPAGEGPVVTARESSEPPASSTTSRSAGLLDQTITQFGQVLGTPRFMAPEQHLGRMADARSDQFSFCVTLYEALYGEIPFEGRGDEYAINVTQGRVRSPPAGSDVPRWLRLTVLRGLSVVASDRFASMDELLTVLRADPMAARKRWLAIAGSAVILLGAGLALRHSRPPAEPPCRGAERKLDGVWDDARKQAVHSSFAATGSPGAEDAFRRTQAALDDYARSWVAMHTDACMATQVRKEQSPELLDLRVECLGERLEELRAQVNVFAHADASIVESALPAARGLPRLRACADIAALRAPVRPPSDEASRVRAEELRTELARAKAQQRSGNYATALTLAEKATTLATALGYRPVEAEALFVLGDVQDDRGDYPASERTLRASFAAALAGHHEAQAALTLTALVAGVGLRQARFAEAHDWAKLAEAETERSSDPVLKGELAKTEGRVFVREGKYEDGRVAIERCLSLWEPALGEDDPSVAGALTDLGNIYFEQGDFAAAGAKYSRSLTILEKYLGPDSPFLAPNLNNLGEISHRPRRLRRRSQRAGAGARALGTCPRPRPSEGGSGPEQPGAGARGPRRRRRLTRDGRARARDLAGRASGRAPGRGARDARRRGGEARQGGLSRRAGDGGERARAPREDLRPLRPRRGRVARVDRRDAPSPEESRGGGAARKGASHRRERSPRPDGRRRRALGPRAGPRHERQGTQPYAGDRSARDLCTLFEPACDEADGRDRRVARRWAGALELCVGLISLQRMAFAADRMRDVIRCASYTSSCSCGWGGRSGSS